MRLLLAKRASLVLPLAVCLLLASTVATTLAQEADPEITARISTLYRQSQAADSLGDYDALMATLEEIETLEITESQSKYLTSLAGWILIERGKMLADQGEAAYEREDYEQGDELHDEALASFDAAAIRDPSSWKALHQRSVSQAMLGEYDDALADIAAAIELANTAGEQEDIDYAKLWFNQAEIQYDQGNYESAVASYTRLLELLPNDPTVVIARGHALLRQGEAQGALADFQRALQTWPDSAVALSARGEAYAALGQWNNAANDLRRAIELDDQFSTAYQRAAWFMATCPQADFRQPELAVQAAEAAIELAEFDDWHNHDVLAAAQARNGDFAAARESIATAQALAENDEEDQATLAELAARAELYANNEPYTLPNP